MSRESRKAAIAQEGGVGLQSPPRAAEPLDGCVRVGATGSFSAIAPLQSTPMPRVKPDQTDDASSRVKVISRVGEILRTLRDEPAGLALSDVVDRTGLPKSTAYRLLLALQHEELVESTAGRFRLGRALGTSGISRHEALRQRLRPLMERLAGHVHETVDLGVLAGDQIQFVEQVRWHSELSVGAIVGELYPTWASACGKALLAATPDHRATALLVARSGLTTAADEAAIQSELEAAAREMLAYDREGFHPGIAGIATFARTGDGDPVSLGIVVPISRFESKLPVLREQLLATQPDLARITASV